MTWVNADILERVVTINECGEPVSGEPRKIKTIKCVIQPVKEYSDYQMYGTRILNMLNVTTRDTIDLTPNTLFGYNGAIYKIVSRETWGKYEMLIVESDV